MDVRDFFAYPTGIFNQIVRDCKSLILIHGVFHETNLTPSIIGEAGFKGLAPFWSAVRLFNRV